MACALVSVCFAAREPQRLQWFWSELLGWEPAGGDTLRPPIDGRFRIRFLPTEEAKAGRNRVHVDLTSTSHDDQDRMVSSALALGARHLDVGQRPEEGHVVLADPEGNEFCVIEPGNQFLAGCGLLGALSCDGTRDVGRFWSAALGWPLVWDQDEETAIQSPEGGPKITWGGPSLTPVVGTDRVRFDLRPIAGDGPAEVERLLSLGATRAGTRPDGPDDVLLLDPDGGPFCILGSPD